MLCVSKNGFSTGIMVFRQSWAQNTVFREVLPMDSKTYNTARQTLGSSILGMHKVLRVSKRTAQNYSYRGIDPGPAELAVELLMMLPEKKRREIFGKGAEMSDLGYLNSGEQFVRTCDRCGEVAELHERGRDLLCDECCKVRDGGPILTTFVYPPIPLRTFDWQAVRDGYEPGALIGWGKTEAEAVADLLQQEEDLRGEA